MTRLRKTMLKPTTYHSPDGTLVVTPTRLKHWVNEFKRFSANKNVATSHWDHQDDPELQVPMTEDEYRSSATAVGKLVDLKETPDGEGVDLIMEFKDPDALRKAENNVVYLSPVISNSFKDGKGNVYRDVITAVDVVIHPVDGDQEPFVPISNEPERVACAIRMGISTYRMSEKSMADDKNKKPDDEKKSKEGDSAKSKDGKEGGGSESNSKLKEVIGCLADVGIVVSDDTDETTLVNNLHQAVLTYKAANGSGDDDLDNLDQEQDSQPAEAAVDGGMTMSVVKKYYTKDMTTRLDALVNSGRATPAEVKERKDSLATIKLSLVPSTGEPKATRLSLWVEDREKLPPNSVVNTKPKTRMSTHVAEPPTTGSDGKETPEDARRVIDELFCKK